MDIDKISELSKLTDEEKEMLEKLLVKISERIWNEIKDNDPDTVNRAFDLCIKLISHDIENSMIYHHYKVRVKKSGE